MSPGNPQHDSTSPSASSPAQTPPWYQTAVFYQLHVRSFFDANGDGTGDFAGLTQKLDYLQWLGVTALWLQPFCVSPLRDDGYDIADYRRISPAYGSLDDFAAFVEAAHQRGLRVVTELVINHTSDQHPWFQTARSSPRGSPERDFYVWSDTPDRYPAARIIFHDYEKSNWAWDPVANAYFWHRFFAHQPDLNFDNPLVQDAVIDTLDYWLKLGVDGLRLDAIPYLYEREGTICENLPETHAFLKKLRKHVDDRFPDRMLLAEANQWPTESVQYFGAGDECHAAFHFPVMPRLYMAVHNGDRRPIFDILSQTPQIPRSCQWLMFLRNHDELTLEMVTPEERELMYRAYAFDSAARINLGIRRRLAPLMGNYRPKLELMHGLLCSLPGSPVLYYGDEIGMGDNLALPDRHGVRTPMQWSAEANGGFSTAPSERLYSPMIVAEAYHYERVNVAAQRDDPDSFLRWVKALIALRRELPALAVGEYEHVEVDNPKIFAFLRTSAEQTVLVALNLSDETLANQNLVVPISSARCYDVWEEQELALNPERLITLTLQPYQFKWLLLERPAA